MNYLAAMGIETWRASAALPGAKVELAVGVKQFFNDSGPVANIVFEEVLSPGVQSLLLNTWQAIESIWHCRSEKISVDAIRERSDIPFLILGKDLAALMSEKGLINAQQLSPSRMGEDPRTVYEKPHLKASWWEIIAKQFSE